MRQIDLANIILPTEYKNLSIAPATPHLANTEVELAQAQGRFVRLREACLLYTSNRDGTVRIKHLSGFSKSKEVIFN